MDRHEGCVIVTGSSGLIGQAVCVGLIRDGYRVFGFDRPGAPDPPAGTDPIACDVTSEDSVAAAITSVRRGCGGAVVSVVHLAAYYDFSGEPSPLYDEVTVLGTDRLLRHLKTLDVGQVVYSSTMLVHAPCAPGEHLDETWALDPAWGYPESKVRAERIIQSGRGRTPAVLLRLAGVYTDRCQSLLLAHQIQRIYERRLTARVFPGDISTGQSMVHLDDVVEIVRSAVARRTSLRPETVLLVGEADPVSYDELQRTFARLIHGDPDWQTTTVPKALAKTGAWIQDKVPGIEEPFIKPWMIDLADAHYALSVSRARSVLNWAPCHALRETLPKMIAALRANPRQWYVDHDLDGAPPDLEARPVVASSLDVPQA
jgi:nucleoside-diphosphate-sugar epimerase